MSEWRLHDGSSIVIVIVIVGGGAAIGGVALYDFGNRLVPFISVDKRSESKVFSKSLSMLFFDNKGRVFKRWYPYK